MRCDARTADKDIGVWVRQRRILNVAVRSLPPAGRAISSYVPGPSRRPPSRPLNTKLLVPALPARVTFARTARARVHRLCLRFRSVAFTQRPWVIRPGTSSTTVKAIPAAAVSE